MKIEVCDLKPGIVTGVEVHISSQGDIYKETYFEWEPSELLPCFKTNEVSAGRLVSWPHVCAFDEIETHIDQELFYFVSGTALMLFIDVMNEEPNTETAQVVRIHAGTQIVIEAGKGHFVPVAQGPEPVVAVVVAPKMDAKKMKLIETIEG
jgi:mannose-6-phosphate isomerase-like protein (cupin superfamily)